MLIAIFNNNAVHFSWMIYGIVCWKHGKTYKLWSTQHMLDDKLIEILVPVHPLSFICQVQLICLVNKCFYSIFILNDSSFGQFTNIHFLIYFAFNANALNQIIILQCFFTISINPQCLI